MSTIREPARELPVVGEFDLCVIGGSCTGLFAAVAAARLGARVALVEAQGLFGGMATAARVCVWHTLLDTRFDKQVIAGLTAETLDRLARQGGLYTLKPSESMNFVFNPHEMTLVLDELACECGDRLRPFLHARFVAPVVDGDRVVAAIIEDKTGRRAIRARYFIDASGDGDLLARAGLPVRVPEPGDLQPPTTVALIQGLKALTQRNPGFVLGRVMFDPKYPTALKPGFMWWADMPGFEDVRLVAGTRVSAANCADGDELTRAEIEGRRQVRQLLRLLRENFDGGDELIRLVDLPGHIGIRESRHAQCLHQLTEQEVLFGTRFDDAIANGTYRVDVHHSDKPGLTFRYLDGREVYIRENNDAQRGFWRQVDPAEAPTFYQIPYRSMVVRGVANVLAAGRLIDADRGAYGAVRVMVNTSQTGQAAGVAAAVALDGDCAFAQVDPARLRSKLADQGALIL